MPLPFNVPDLSQEDLQPQQQAPESGFDNRVKQFGYAVEDGFDQAGTVFDPEKFMMSHLNPGPIQQLDDTHKDLKKEYPNGIGQNVLNLINEEKEHNDFVERRLSYAPQGHLNDFSQFVGRSIGTMINPVNALSGWIAPEMLPEKMLADMTVATKAGQFSLHGARGAAIGETVNTAMNLNNYYYDKQLGNNPQPGQIFNGWKLAGGLGFIGGGIYGLTRPTRVAGATADADLLNTAVTQANADKPVDVTVQAQQSMAEQAQAMKDQGFDADQVKKNSNDLGDQISGIDSKLDEDDDVPGVSDKIGLGKLNKLNENLRNHATLDASGQRYNTDVQSLDYMNNLQNISSNHPELRTVAQQKQLRDFQDNPETEMDMLNKFDDKNNSDLDKTQGSIDSINSDMQSNRDKIAKLNAKMSKVPEGGDRSAIGQQRLDEVNDMSQKANFLQDHLDNWKHQTKVKQLIEDRRNEISDLGDKSPEQINHALNREKLKSLKNDLQRMKDSEDAQLAAVNTEPTTKEKVVQTRTNMNSPETDIAYGDPDNTRIDEDIPDGFPHHLDDLKAKAQEFVDKGLIDKSEIEKITGVHDLDPEKLKKLDKGIDDYYKCRGGK